MSRTITARRLVQNNRIVDYPIVTVEDGQIAHIDTCEMKPLPAGKTRGSTFHAYPEAILVPSYIDIHVHGAAGQDVMQAAPHAVTDVARFLGSRGVGAFLPTTVTASRDETLHALDRLADAIEGPARSDGAAAAGIHLEGPFLSHAKRGVHSPAFLEPPSVSLFERFWQASRGNIRLMTIAPELEAAPELIAYATELGVRCSLGHSDATVEHAAAGFRAGARSATHILNAMRAINQRDPGIAAYVLDNEEMFAELICDGIHVDPLMVRLFFKTKGPAQAILITDGISATGMPDGRYQLGNLEVDVQDGRCTLAGTTPGILAGSVLTLDQAVRNFSSFTGSGLDVAVRLATRNPAQLLGIDDRWGVLDEGREANLLVLSIAGDLIQIFRRGQPLLE